MIKIDGNYKTANGKNALVLMIIENSLFPVVASVEDSENGEIRVQTYSETGVSSDGNHADNLVEVSVGDDMEPAIGDIVLMANFDSILPTIAIYNGIGEDDTFIGLVDYGGTDLEEELFDVVHTGELSLESAVAELSKIRECDEEQGTVEEYDRDISDEDLLDILLSEEGSDEYIEKVKAIEKMISHIANGNFDIKINED